MPRPTLDEYFVKMLDLVASRSTCRRRNVACIITNDKGQIISTGYNGVPSGLPHCIDIPCAGAGDKSGDNTRCLAIHAEQNALLQAGSKLYEATRLYCSCSPCFSCAKLIAGTKIKRIVAKELYADVQGLELLRAAGVNLYIATFTSKGEMYIAKSAI